jgi:hypothetical protein
MNLIGFSGLFGPPIFLGLEWFKRSTVGEKSSPRWRRILHDVALVGASLEFVAFWMVFLFSSSFSRGDEWGWVRIWEKWMLISSYSCVSFVAIALLGKGKGKLFTILCCVCIICGLMAVDATR